MTSTGPVLVTSFIVATLISACAPQSTNTSPDDTGNVTTEPTYKAEGTKGLTRRQADWINRSHSRPAGR